MLRIGRNDNEWLKKIKIKQDVAGRGIVENAATYLYIIKDTIFSRPKLSCNGLVCFS